LSAEAGDLNPHALQEAGKLGGRSELRYRIELLERRREGVRQAPQGAGFELRVSRPVSANLAKNMADYGCIGSGSWNTAI
jgi:hypothetical protein